jgi:hypothetical protein
MKMNGVRFSQTHLQTRSHWSADALKFETFLITEVCCALFEEAGAIRLTASLIKLCKAS